MSKSKIVKATFVSMSDIRKEIKTVDPMDPKIIPNLEDSVLSELSPMNETTEDSTREEAIDDNVIDGSTSIVLEQAQAEADRMVREAGELAEQITEEARQRGFDMGYQEGKDQSTRELDAREAQLNQRAIDLEEAYEANIKAAEPKIAKIIKQLVEGIVGHYAINEEVILFLIHLALSEITTYGSFIVKVSPEDFDYVKEHKDTLTEGLSDRIDIEVLMDKNLGSKDCIVETDYGNVDASLQLRLGSLSKELGLIGDSLNRNRN